MLVSGALDALRFAGMFVPHHELGKQEVLEWLVSGFPASRCEVPRDIKPPSLIIVLTSRASSLWIVRPPIFGMLELSAGHHLYAVAHLVGGSWHFQFLILVHLSQELSILELIFRQ